MKKFMFVLVAAFGLLATSCSKDETTTPPFEGGNVAFTVVAPELATRTIGDGTTATTLEYAVYDAEWNHIAYLDGTTTISLQTTVELELIDGKVYNLIFWAQNAAAPYTFDVETKKVTVDYAGIKSNHEAHDAFYATVENLKVKSGLNKTVELFRPFAQLNIGTADWAAIENSDEVFTKTQVKVKAYDTLNLVDGEVSGGAERTFDFEVMPTETLSVNNTPYKWLALNYLLVNDKELVEVTFNADNADVAEKLWNNVPVQRNHKTHIVGKLLTSLVDFEVIIRPAFDDPDYVVDENTTHDVTVNTAAELQAAIDAATGRTNIIFGQDITAASTINVLQKQAAKDLIIDGSGYKFDGKILVNGNARAAGKETLTFKDIHFYTESTTEFTFIDAPSKVNNKYNYSHNVTIVGCTFEFGGNGAVTEIGSASFTGTYNLVMADCEAINMHSLLQVQSCDNTVKVRNVTVTEGKNGISFGNTAYPTIVNANIKTREYGVRADGNASRGNLVIENSTIDAKQPVIVRKVTTDGYSVALNNTTLITEALYSVVFTSGSDDAAYVAPTKAFSITGAEGYNVFPK